MAVAVTDPTGTWRGLSATAGAGSVADYTDSGFIGGEGPNGDPGAGHQVAVFTAWGSINTFTGVVEVVFMVGTNRIRSELAAIAIKSTSSTNRQATGGGSGYYPYDVTFEQTSSNKLDLIGLATGMKCKIGVLSLTGSGEIHLYWAATRAT